MLINQQAIFGSPIFRTPPLEHSLAPAILALSILRAGYSTARPLNTMTAAHPNANGRLAQSVLANHFLDKPGCLERHSALTLPSCASDWSIANTALPEGHYKGYKPTSASSIAGDFAPWKNRPDSNKQIFVCISLLILVFSGDWDQQAIPTTTRNGHCCEIYFPTVDWFLLVTNHHKRGLTITVSHSNHYRTTIIVSNN